MKTKLFLLAAAFSSGFAMLGAQDAPKPPQAPGGPPGGPPGGGDPQARFDEAYKKMDANSDGKVSKEEFLVFSMKEAEDRFSKLDAAGSGSVSKEQLADAMRRMRGGEGGGQRRPEGFTRPESGGTRPRPGGDNNAPGGNPPPPPAEGSDRGQGAPGGQGGPGMRGGGGAGSSGIGELFRKVQENGSVTKEEFTKMSEEQFKRMDPNGDGKITKEEMEELGKKMREMRGGQGAAPGAAPGGPPQGGGEGGFRRPPSGAGGAPQGDRPKRPEAN